MKFINKFEKEVKNTIEEYHLFNKKDKIIVACSGGKDSTTILYLLKKFGYKVEALSIDLLIGEWSKQNLENIKKFCKDQKIKLHIVNLREEMGSSICYIRSGIQEKIKLNNCMICGIMKRWILNRKARELKATKIVTGHNLDDEAETVIMNILKGNPQLSVNLGPTTGTIKDEKFVQRVKPLYFTKEEEIIKYSKLMNFPVLYEHCPCSVAVFRRDIRNAINKLEVQEPNIKLNTVKNFLNILPLIKERYKSDIKLKYCNICGEPTRREICKKCELMNILRR